MIALATWALWSAANRPIHRDFESASGRCWWCASPIAEVGWPVRLLPDTFPTPMLARAKSSTHLCAPCGWTLASGFTLPRELAATRLRERGHDAADEAYRVARELAPHELLPSPTWEVMCSEMEWPV